jgi:hypothetical protein
MADLENRDTLVTWVKVLATAVLMALAIYGLHHIIVDTQATIDNNQKTIDVINRNLERNQAEIDERNKMNERNKMIRFHLAEIKERNRVIAERNRELAAGNEDIAARNMAIDAQIKALNQQIEMRVKTNAEITRIINDYLIKQAEHGQGNPPAPRP